VTVAHGTTRADFYAGRYCLSADVLTGERRLVEALRDPTRQFLEVRQLHVVALDGSEPPAEYPEGLLSKTDVEWVAVRAEPPRAEARLYGFVKKSPVRVAFVLHNCRIEGTVHIESGSTDPVNFFLRGLEKGERFILVTGATVTPPPMETDEMPGLVIVNRLAVHMFSVLRA
jgi:hypothetical protein